MHSRKFLYSLTTLLISVFLAVCTCSVVYANPCSGNDEEQSGVPEISREYQHNDSIGEESIVNPDITKKVGGIEVGKGKKIKVSIPLNLQFNEDGSFSKGGTNYTLRVEKTQVPTGFTVEAEVVGGSISITIEAPPYDNTGVEFNIGEDTPFDIELQIKYQVQGSVSPSEEDGAKISIPDVKMPDRGVQFLCRGPYEVEVGNEFSRDSRCCFDCNDCSVSAQIPLSSWITNRAGILSGTPQESDRGTSIALTASLEGREVGSGSFFVNVITPESEEEDTEEEDPEEEEEEESDPCAGGCGCGTDQCLFIGSDREGFYYVQKCSCAPKGDSCKQKLSYRPCYYGCSGSGGQCASPPDHTTVLGDGEGGGGGGDFHPEPNRYIKITTRCDGRECENNDKEVKVITISARDGYLGNNRNNTRWRVFAIPRGVGKTCREEGKRIFRSGASGNYDGYGYNWENEAGFFVGYVPVTPGVRDTEDGFEYGESRAFLAAYTEGETVYLKKKEHNNLLFCFASKSKAEKDINANGDDTDIEYARVVIGKQIEGIRRFVMDPDIAPGAPSQFNVCGFVDSGATVSIEYIKNIEDDGSHTYNIDGYIYCDDDKSRKLPVSSTDGGEITCGSDLTKEEKRWCLEVDDVATEEHIKEIRAIATDPQGHTTPYLVPRYTVNPETGEVVPENVIAEGEEPVTTTPPPSYPPTSYTSIQGCQAGSQGCDQETDDTVVIPYDPAERTLITIPKKKESGLIIDCSFGEAEKGKENCGIKHLFELANNIMKLLLWVALIGAGIVIFWKGVKLATHIYWGSHEAARKEFQEALKGMVIGLIFILGAYAIVRAGFTIIGYRLNSGDPFKFNAESLPPTAIPQANDTTDQQEEKTADTTTASTTQQRKGVGSTKTGVPRGCDGCQEELAGSGIPHKSELQNGCKNPEGDSCWVAAEIYEKLKILKSNYESPVNWWVSESCPPTFLHQASCHKQENCTCVDVSFTSSGAATAENIKHFIEKAKAAGLRPVYEVKTNTKRNQLVRGGVPAENIITETRITGPHFSVYSN